MEKFNPSDTYDSLLIQASALFRLYKSKEAECAYLHNKINECDFREVESLKAQLESERQINHMLTNEIQGKYEQS